MTALPSSLSHADFGLRPDSKPLGKRTWQRYAHGSSYPGVFASTKCMGPAAFENLLEKDFHILLSADPRVEVYAVQAHQLNYWTPATDTAVQRRYTPDFVVRLKNGPILVVEVKAEFLKRQPYWCSREPHIREAYRRDFSVPFVVVTESEIRLEPRLSNFREMLRAGSRFVDPEAEIAVRDVLAIPTQDMTIARVIEKTSLRDNKVARSYGALMSLALCGEISIDLKEPLSLSSIIQRLV